MKRMFILASAAVALAIAHTPALAQSAPIRMCSGSDSGVYYAAGETIRSMGGNIGLVNKTSGGTIENLDRVLDLDAADPNACDIMIGQPNGPSYIATQSPAKVKKLRKVAELHREYLQLLCNAKSGVARLSDLADNPTKFALDVGQPNSGAWLIWQNIITQDKRYADVQVKNEGDILALSAVAAGDAPAAGGTTCMLIAAGLKNGTIREADNTFPDNVRLLPVDDSAFAKATDVSGQPLYTFAAIPEGTFPNGIQPAGGVFSSGAVKTITWNASVYVNTDRVDAKNLSKVIQVVSRSANGIRAEFGK